MLSVAPFFYALLVSSALHIHTLSVTLCSATRIRVAHLARPRRVAHARTIETRATPEEIQDMRTIHSRRIETIVGAVPSSSVSQIPAWLQSLDANGKWPDSEVDYSTGCNARRANWPAQVHWNRIQTMAAAWRGGLAGAETLENDANLRQAISLAMSYWFSRDYTNLACLDAGGTDRCPCANEENSLWNTNWFSNVILIPEYVGATCLLLNDTLVESEYNNCTHFTTRPYGLFFRPIYNMGGGFTGANAVDVAKIAVDGGLLSLNATLVLDAYRKAQAELVIRDTVKADGIRRDGAFAQHAGVLYNGNYGKDYSNAIIDLEIESAGTSFAAEPSARQAFETLFDGNKWMIFKNSLSGVLHWDFSTLGRFITFPIVDNQATGSIKTNLTRVQRLGELWSSNTLLNYATSLQKPTSHANAGELTGNHMFFTSDYMVHRGSNYITTVKMFSSRTQNTECINTQNPFGFHLSDGAHYTWLRGDEYNDISAAWDWDKIPGITTDYQNTPLACNTATRTGVEQFVGGVSDGEIGIATMRFNNPTTRALQFQKSWFFMKGDVQHVMVAGLASSSSAPVISVLDQKRRQGPILLNGNDIESVSNVEARTLWHSNVGYVFPRNGGPSLSVEVGEKTGDWSRIGTSTQPPTTVDLFSAWLQHPAGLEATSYTVHPGVTAEQFHRAERHSVDTVQNDEQIAAVYDHRSDIAMVVFWSASGGSITIQRTKGGPITLSASANVAVIYRVEEGKITVSDPSQTVSTVRVEVCARSRGNNAQSVVLDFALPSGGLAGSSVTQPV